MVDFVVAIQSTGEGEPGEGALNNPSLGQNHEFARFIAFDHFDSPTEHSVCPSNEFSGVAAVSKDLLDARY